MGKNILFDGNGSKEVPFLIKDVRDFLLLDFCQHNYFVDKFFIIKNDIDLKGLDYFKPIGIHASGFRGVLDGEGKSIKNLYLDIKKLKVSMGVSDLQFNIGIFSGLYSSGVLKNINLENIQIISDSRYVGGLVGYNDCGNIDNCKIDGNSIIKGYMHVGGIVGGGDKENSNCESEAKCYEKEKVAI